jgi:hypothetical protein
MSGAFYRISHGSAYPIDRTLNGMMHSYGVNPAISYYNTAGSLLQICQTLLYANHGIPGSLWILQSFETNNMDTRLSEDEVPIKIITPKNKLYFTTALVVGDRETSLRATALARKNYFIQLEVPRSKTLARHYKSFNIPQLHKELRATHQRALQDYERETHTELSFRLN